MPDRLPIFPQPSDFIPVGCISSSSDGGATTRVLVEVKIEPRQFRALLMAIICSGESESTPALAVLRLVVGIEKECGL